jgi:hypothetical protein
MMVPPGGVIIHQVTPTGKQRFLPKWVIYWITCCAGNLDWVAGQPGKNEQRACLLAVVYAGAFQVAGKLPFDKLRANGKAYPFALSLSKGEFAPKLK